MLLQGNRAQLRTPFQCSRHRLAQVFGLRDLTGLVVRRNNLLSPKRGVAVRSKQSLQRVLDCGKGCHTRIQSVQPPLVFGLGSRQFHRSQCAAVDQSPIYRELLAAQIDDIAFHNYVLPGSYQIPICLFHAGYHVDHPDLVVDIGDVRPLPANVDFRTDWIGEAASQQRLVDAQQ